MKKTAGILIAFFSVLGLLLLAVHFFPIDEVISYSRDEGANLIKSFLLLEGYSLYTQIWSDQPPLFSIILAGWFKVFGMSVYAARVLSLLFSSLLLVALFNVVKMARNTLSAFICVILLSLSYMYLGLSVRVIIGIPALAIAVISIFFVFLYERAFLKRYLVLSGIIFALAMHTKFNVAVVFPMLILKIIAVEWGRGERHKKLSGVLHSLIVWLVPFLLTYGVIFFVTSMDVSQVFGTHLIVRGKEVLPTTDSPYVVRYFIRRDFSIVLLAFFALMFSMSKKEWYLVFPAIWVIVGYACLLSHKPIWDHHYPLVSIPACWMASCGIAELLNRKNWPAVFLSRRPREVFNVVMMVAIILSAFLLIRNAPKKVKHIRKLVTVEKKRDREAIERMKAYSDKVDFAFVDMSIYAFYAQIPVPPELGVITWKRRKVGKLGSAMVRSVVRQYKPGLILLSRYRKNEMRLDKYLERNYELIYQNSSPWIRLYAMKGLN